MKKKQTRTIMRSFRVTPDEYAKLEKNAAKAGFESVSNFIRFKLKKAQAL